MTTNKKSAMLIDHAAVTAKLVNLGTFLTGTRPSVKSSEENWWHSYYDQQRTSFSLFISLKGSEEYCHWSGNQKDLLSLLLWLEKAEKPLIATVQYNSGATYYPSTA